MASTRSLDGEVLSIVGDAEALITLEEIEQRDGELKVNTVIETARPEDSPLHRHFTWDVEEGFRKNLEKEARDLIRSYKIEIVRDDKVVKVPRFVSVESGDGRAYRRAEEVASIESFAQTYKLRLLKQMEALSEKLKAFEEFQVVVVAIEEASKRLASVES